VQRYDDCCSPPAQRGKHEEVILVRGQDDDIGLLVPKQAQGLQAPYKHREVKPQTVQPRRWRNVDQPVVADLIVVAEFGHGGDDHHSPIPLPDDAEQLRKIAGAEVRWLSCCPGIGVNVAGIDRSADIGNRQRSCAAVGHGIEAYIVDRIGIGCAGLARFMDGSAKND
jgi:hypothetical protein